MRGADTFTESLFTMRKLEDFVPAQHPLREIRRTANAALDVKPREIIHTFCEELGV
jgi:hypothetical protein